MSKHDDHEHLDSNTPGMFPEAAGCSADKSKPQKRSSPWDSSYHALKYVTAIPRDNFRTTDKITEILVFCCLVFIALLIFVPPTFLTPPVILLADIIFFSITVIFIMKRLGILITLNARQAVLVWDIVIAALIIGIILSFNAMKFIKYLVHVPFKL